MNPTKLLYMEDMQQLSCEAQVESIDNENGKTIIYLDQTVFYPLAVLTLAGSTYQFIKENTRSF